MLNAYFCQDQGQINEKKIEKIVACSMSRQEVLTAKLKIMRVAELIYTNLFTKGGIFFYISSF